jgi:hypothetical protein
VRPGCGSAHCGLTENSLSPREVRRQVDVRIRSENSTAVEICRRESSNALDEIGTLVPFWSEVAMLPGKHWSAGSVLARTNRCKLHRFLRAGRIGRQGSAEPFLISAPRCASTVLAGASKGLATCLLGVLMLVASLAKRIRESCQKSARCRRRPSEGIAPLPCAPSLHPGGNS